MSIFTEAQIAFALKQFESGTRVEEVSRKNNISESTYPISIFPEQKNLPGAYSFQTTV